MRSVSRFILPRVDARIGDLMLQTFQPETSEEEVIEALARDGGVIVEGLVSDDVLDRISDELQPHFEVEGAKFQNDFNGYKTRRLGAILALSHSSAELIAHPYVLSIADALLLQHCKCYRLPFDPRLRNLGVHDPVRHHRLARRLDRLSDASVERRRPRT